MFENPSPAIHRGAIDKTTITSQPPQRVMEGMVTLLRDMEVLIEEESSFKYTCVKSQSIGSSVNVSFFFCLVVGLCLSNVRDSLGTKFVSQSN